MKTYYLSEMNVSDKHGGGLTLQRILGDDIDRLDGLVQLTSPYENFTTKDRYLGKEIRLWEQVPRFVWKKMPKRFSPDYLTNQFKRVLGMPNPKYLDHDYYYHNLIPILRKKIEPGSKMLIVPQYSPSVLVTNTMFREMKIRYGAWMMDDHVLQYDQKKGYFYAPRNYTEEFGAFLRNAEFLFVISENMRQFYLDRFGVDSKVLFGPSDMEPGIKIPEPNATGPIRLCYFGAIWKWQSDALDKISGALDKLNATLDVYTFNKLGPEVLKSSRITVKDPVSSDKVKGIMRTYDGVVILYGFDDVVRALSELNNSTKLSECLASGVPTVLVGPPYGAMTKFAEQYQCGVVLSDLDNEEQIARFRTSFNAQGRVQLLERAAWVADNVTSTAAMRKTWSDGWENFLKAK